MLSMKLLLAFGVLSGIFVDKCNLGDLNVAEVANKVIVTNASSGGDAFVEVSFDHNDVSWHVPAGASKTASGLAATKYAVHVLAPTSEMWLSYEDRLKLIRDELVEVSLDPATPPDKVLEAAAQLPSVVEALQQLQGSKFVQSCSGVIQSGVESHATVQFTKSEDGIGFWVLDCG